MLLGGSHTWPNHEVGPDLVAFPFLIEFRVKEKEVRMILRQGINKHIYSLTEIGSFLWIEAIPLSALQTVSVHLWEIQSFECVNFVLNHARSSIPTSSV